MSLSLFIMTVVSALECLINNESEPTQADKNVHVRFCTIQELSLTNWIAHDPSIRGAVEYSAFVQLTIFADHGDYRETIDPQYPCI